MALERKLSVILNFQQRPQDWTQQEIAEFYRVESALVQSGLNVGTDRGQTDEGDPWFLFYRLTDHEPVVHFARIDGQYLIVSAAFDGPLRGYDFRKMILGLLARHQLPMALKTASNNVYLHPATILIVLVGAAFFKMSTPSQAAELSASSSEPVAADVSEAVSQEIARSHRTGEKKSPTSHQNPGDNMQELVAYTLAHESIQLAVAAVLTLITPSSANADGPTKLLNPDDFFLKDDNFVILSHEYLNEREDLSILATALFLEVGAGPLSNGELILSQPTASIVNDLPNSSNEGPESVGEHLYSKPKNLAVGVGSEFESVYSDGPLNLHPLSTQFLTSKAQINEQNLRSSSVFIGQVKFDLSNYKTEGSGAGDENSSLAIQMTTGHSNNYASHIINSNISTSYQIKFGSLFASAEEFLNKQNIYQLVSNMNTNYNFDSSNFSSSPATVTKWESSLIGITNANSAEVVLENSVSSYNTSAYGKATDSSDSAQKTQKIELHIFTQDSSNQLAQDFGVIMLDFTYFFEGSFGSEPQHHHYVFQTQAAQSGGMLGQINLEFADGSTISLIGQKPEIDHFISSYI